MRFYLTAVTFLLFVTTSPSIILAAGTGTAKKAPEKKEGAVAAVKPSEAADTTVSAAPAPEAEKPAGPETAEDFRKLGDRQLKKKNVEEAMKSYRLALEKGPDDTANARIALAVGTNCLKMKEYADAQKYLSMVTGSKRNLPAFQLMLGEAFQKNGQNDSAITLLEPLAAKQKPPKDVFRIIGDAAVKIDSTDKAITMYRKYVALGGAKTADIAYLLAFALEKSAPVKARQSYTANTRSFPKDYRNFFRLGLLNTGAKSTLPTALGLLKKAAELTDSIPSIWIDIGNVYLSMGKKEDALTAYRTCLHKDENNLEAKIRLGNALLESGSAGDALSYLEKAHKQAPDSAGPMISLASAYLKTGNTQKAVEMLVKIKSVQPKNLEARKQLIEAYRKTGQDRKALEEIKESLEVERDYELLVPYAKLLIKLGKPEEAQAPLEEIIGMMPDNIDALMTMAMLKRKTGALDEAVEIYKEVCMYDTKYAPALYERAEVHFEQDKAQWAEMFYQRALAADPQYALAEVGLAKLALLFKKKDECYDHLNKASALAPSDPEVQKAIDAVRNPGKASSSQKEVSSSGGNASAADADADVEKNVEDTGKKGRRRRRK